MTLNQIKYRLLCKRICFIEEWFLTHDLWQKIFLAVFSIFTLSQYSMDKSDNKDLFLFVLHFYDPTSWTWVSIWRLRIIQIVENSLVRFKVFMTLSMKIIIRDITPFSFTATYCPVFPEYWAGALIWNIGIYVSMKIHSTTCLIIMVYPCVYRVLPRQPVLSQLNAICAFTLFLQHPF